MKKQYFILLVITWMLVIFNIKAQNTSVAAHRVNAPLPDGASKDVWGLDDAWRQTTPTREKISMNGLWGFRPVLTNEESDIPPAPEDCWGWFKVPAIWPSGRWDSDRGAQNVVLSPWLKENSENAVLDQAWYKRKITVPRSFEGKRAVLDFTMLQTHAKAFVDGAYVGELWFPGGELDLTTALTPGKEQEIALLVTARPFSVMNQAFMGINNITETRATVRFRGITGDLYLTAMPSAARLDDAQVVTSTRDGAVTFIVETANLANALYQLRAEVKGCGESKTFSSKGLTAAPDGTLRFTAEWKNPKLWDTHTAENRYTVTLSLLDASGKIIDMLTPVTFGFREIHIEGRNFILNGSPVHLRAFHNTIMSSTADKANTAAAREHCRRLKQYGFNAIIAGNYDFNAGNTGYLDGLLEACDEEGILFAFSLPHIKDFSTNLRNPENAERYRQLSRWIIRRVRNHPAVILYAMNHNSCGYFGDVNPLKIDGIFEMPEGTGVTYNVENAWWERNRPQARIAEAIATALDPTRPVYHHESGNLGALHCSNVYLNWAPRQERSEWLEHWATVGVKPLFFVEWGLPHISNWSSYRGPKFIWSHPAFQSLWISEYAAQFWGDAAYQSTSEAHAALAHEEMLWATGEEFTWQRLQGPLRVMTNNYHNIMAYYTDDNWPALRTWGISAILPWDSGDFWRRVSNTPTRPAPGSFQNLKSPGIVPDNLLSGSLFVYDTNGDPAAFAPNPIGSCFLRWNMPDCAYICGAPAFTDKTHLYLPSTTVTKALVILNDRRKPQTVKWQCSLVRNGKELKKLSGKVTVPIGGQVRVPVAFTLPKDAGDFALNASFDFEDKIRQVDNFALRVVAPPPPTAIPSILLYDTKGITAKHFDRLGVQYQVIDKYEPGTPMKAIVIGRESLDETSVRWVKDMTGDRVLVMEQSSKQLADLFGFRIAERGSRLLFPRFPHPITQDLGTEDLRDWTGTSTLLPEYLTNIDEIEIHNPQWQWCGQTSTRVWRCGNRHSVASVLIEKPAVGDWRALIDGEFDLQYSPLLEYVQGLKRVIFCQLDVSGRTTPDPIADILTMRILSELSQPGKMLDEKSTGASSVMIRGKDARQLCDNLGVSDNSNINCLIASSGAEMPGDLHQRIANGTKALCLGMSAEEISKWSPIPLDVNFTNAYFTRIENIPHELNGLSNADWAWHSQMSFYAFPVIPEGNQAIRVIRHGKGYIIFWQVPPWQIDEVTKPYLRTSKRRANAMAARLISNLGITSQRFPQSLYLDTPENVDDPYRFFKW